MTEKSAPELIKKQVPRAKKPTSRVNPPPVHKSRAGSQRGRSQEVIGTYRKPEDGVVLSAAGQEAYQKLLAQNTLDVTWLEQITETKPGDKDKIVRFLQNLVLGARHRDALSDVGWVWSDISSYRQRSPGLQKVYTECKRIGEEFRAIVREDEAHRRAVDGVEEPIYSVKGEYLGTKLRYSDALLAMFLKADNPDKFMERQEVKTSGVVLQVRMGLREVRQTSLTPSQDEPKEPPK